MHSLADDVETTVGQNLYDLGATVTLSEDVFDRGTYVLSGEPQERTTLLQDWCVQWAEAGHGFCYVHPRGPAPQEILARLPDNRLEDVVWLDFRRSRLTDHLDISKTERVGIDPFEGPEEPIDIDALVTDPNEARIADFVAVCSEYDSFDWNVGRILTTVLPWLFEEPFPNHSELTRALYEAGSNETVEPLLHLAPKFGDRTARTHLNHALTVDPEAFMIAKRCLGWPRDPLTRNPFEETTYALHDALTEEKIVLVTGGLPADGAWSSDPHTDRLGTRLLVTTVIQRLWEAAQTHATATKFPLLLDGIADLVPEPSVRVREILEHGEDTPLQVVASGPLTPELPDSVEHAIEEFVDTWVVSAGDGRPQLPVCLWDGNVTTIDWLLENGQTNDIEEGLLWWIRTGIAGEAADELPTATQIDAAISRDSSTAKRESDAVADAIASSIDRYGAEPAWLREN
jgi:hypothetical protein